MNRPGLFVRVRQLRAGTSCATFVCSIPEELFSTLLTVRGALNQTSVLFDYSDRWDEISADAHSTLTICVVWLDAPPYSPRAQESAPQGPCQRLAGGTSFANGHGGPDGCGVRREELRKKMKTSLLKRCIATAGGRNVVPEMQELAATLLLHHCHCKQGYRELSKSKSRIQRGLQSFTLERGLHDNANDDDSTLARLAKTFLAFPVSSIASERVSRRLGMS